MSRPSKYTKTMHVKITVRVPDGLKDRLIALGVQEGSSLSDLSREAYERLLDSRGVGKATH